MITKLHSFILKGIEAVPVTVETEVADSGIGIHLVGPKDPQVRETLMRVLTAMRAAGYNAPGKKTVINITPAVKTTDVALLDLPIAIGILTATKQVDCPLTEDTIVAGELALDGTIRTIRGGYCAGMLAKEQGKDILLPPPAAAECESLGISNFAAKTLEEAVETLKYKPKYRLYQYLGIDKHLLKDEPATDLSNIACCESAKRAVEIAAAGGHPIFLVGEEGVGKTMLAKTLTKLLPPLSDVQLAENRTIYSAAGLATEDFHLVTSSPFRAPNHAASLSAIYGGGPDMLPGEVTLAHNGVLCLQNITMFTKNSLETMRRVMQDKKVTIARASGKLTYPAAFLPVFTDTPQNAEAALKNLAGSGLRMLMDMVDIHAEVTPAKAVQKETMTDIFQRIDKARELQYERLGAGRLNADMTRAEVTKHCFIRKDCLHFLIDIFTHMELSKQSYGKVLRIARTIADLEGEKDIQETHLAEAASFRFLDRNYSNKQS